MSTFLRVNYIGVHTSLLALKFSVFSKADATYSGRKFFCELLEINAIFTIFN